MERKELTARELVLFYLSRIGQIDQCEGGLNAVLEANPDALFIADMLDEERGQGNVRGPLHGIPIMLKDTINTADKMHTSAGSLALADNLAPYDAHVVTRLRQAGAIMLGKTNMTEFANFMGERMPAGYSSRGGQVLSPYNRDCSPSGSSTGSAVAVAAG
jgi:amidase